MDICAQIDQIFSKRKRDTNKTNLVNNVYKSVPNVSLNSNYVKPKIVYTTIEIKIPPNVQTTPNTPIQSPVIVVNLADGYKTNNCACALCVNTHKSTVHSHSNTQFWQIPVQSQIVSDVVTTPTFNRSYSAPTSMSQSITTNHSKLKKRSKLQQFDFSLAKYLDKRVKKKIQQFNDNTRKKKSCSVDNLKVIEKKLNELNMKHEQLKHALLNNNNSYSLQRRKSISAQNLVIYDTDDPKAMLHKSIKQRLNDKLKYHNIESLSSSCHDLGSLENNDLLKRPVNNTFTKSEQLNRTVSLSDLSIVSPSVDYFSDIRSKSLTNLGNIDSQFFNQSSSKYDKYYTIHAGMKMSTDLTNWSLNNYKIERSNSSNSCTSNSWLNESNTSLVNYCQQSDELLCQFDRIKIPWSKCAKVKNSLIRKKQRLVKHLKLNKFSNKSHKGAVVIPSLTHVANTSSPHFRFLDTNYIQDKHLKNPNMIFFSGPTSEHLFQQQNLVESSGVTNSVLVSSEQSKTNLYATTLPHLSSAVIPNLPSTAISSLYETTAPQQSPELSTIVNSQQQLLLDHHQQLVTSFNVQSAITTPSITAALNNTLLSVNQNTNTTILENDDDITLALKNLLQRQRTELEALHQKHQQEIEMLTKRIRKSPSVARETEPIQSASNNEPNITGAVNNIP